ncbi:unnamed protein product [Protopolystoma xenopodis]|uniref:Uncharacterized protein n=1 Tax=Protopolystoma xenopodis TaxID=117903 RepID=A0A3S5B9D5_9PLAT|nr:unnamed protein product [Protopolystoma xenopodis]
MIAEDIRPLFGALVVKPGDLRQDGEGQGQESEAVDGRWKEGAVPISARLGLQIEQQLLVGKRGGLGGSPSDAGENGAAAVTDGSHCCLPVSAAATTTPTEDYCTSRVFSTPVGELVPSSQCSPGNSALSLLTGLSKEQHHQVQLPMTLSASTGLPQARPDSALSSIVLTEAAVGSLPSAHLLILTNTAQLSGPSPGFGCRRL